jgi:hypothetical protein
MEYLPTMTIRSPLLLIELRVEEVKSYTTEVFFLVHYTIEVLISSDDEEKKTNITNC